MVTVAPSLLVRVTAPEIAPFQLLWRLVDDHGQTYPCPIFSKRVYFFLGSPTLTILPESERGNRYIIFELVWAHAVMTAFTQTHKYTRDITAEPFQPFYFYFLPHSAATSVHTSLFYSAWGTTWQRPQLMKKAPLCSCPVSFIILLLKTQHYCSGSNMWKTSTGN